MYSEEISSLRGDLSEIRQLSNQLEELHTSGILASEGGSFERRSNGQEGSKVAPRTVRKQKSKTMVQRGLLTARPSKKTAKREPLLPAPQLRIDEAPTAEANAFFQSSPIHQQAVNHHNIFTGVEIEEVKNNFSSE